MRIHGILDVTLAHDSWEPRGERKGEWKAEPKGDARNAVRDIDSTMLELVKRLLKW